MAGKRSTSGAVVLERQVRHGDDDVRAEALENRQILRGRISRIDDADVRELVRADLAGGEAEADEADLDAADGLDQVGSGAADRLAGCPVDHVGHDPLKVDSDMRFTSTSRPKSNSWLPSVAMSRPAAFSAAIVCSPWNTLEATEGRQEVSRENEEDRAALSGDSLLQRGDARQAAAAVHRLERVDVVQLQEGERRPRPRRRLVVFVVSILGWRRRRIGRGVRLQPDAPPPTVRSVRL